MKMLKGEFDDEWDQAIEEWLLSDPDNVAPMSD